MSMYHPSVLVPANTRLSREVDTSYFFPRQQDGGDTVPIQAHVFIPTLTIPCQ
ncbi:hypothetical protein ACRRTK_013097 [Alexandromys fortis]